MATNTTTLQGTFTGTGGPVFIPFVSGIDWLQVYNLTQMNASPNPHAGIQWYWQRQMIAGSGIEYFNTAGTQVLNAAFVTPAFFLYDSTNPPQNAPVVIAAGTNAVQPVFTTGTTTNLFTGSIVRVTNLATTPNLNGYDFSIDTIIPATSFRVKNALANAPGAVTGAGFYQLISSFGPTPQTNVPYWYPSNRRIVNITQANPAVITTSVDSAYIAGQAIRLAVPPQFGMTQADSLVVNVISVNGGNITVNLDTTGFTAFKFPLNTVYPFTPAQCVPVGEETDQFSNPNLLDDATINTGQTGIVLMGGINGPAGQNADNIIWIGGKTFNGS